MISFFTHLKKSVAGLIVLSLVLSVVSLPRKAEAALPVVDVVGVPFQSLSAAHNLVVATQSLITGAHDTKDTLVSFVLKPLAIVIAHAAIQSITLSTVNWINSGFDGSPAFATDLKKNLRQLGDGIAQNYLTELANTSAIHSPFIDDLVTNVGAGYYLYTGRQALASRLRYTLNQSAADDKAFLAGDFNQGGWNAWFSTFMNPANNPYGAQMIASQALAGRIEGAANQRVQELGWGSGFLSWRGKCTKTASKSVAEVPASLSDAEGCLEHEIITPGTAAAGKLQKVTDIPLDQLGVANSIDQVVGALAQQLVSKVLGGGGLRGASQPSSGGGPSAVTQSSTGSNATSNLSVSNGFAQTISSTQIQVQTYQKDWQTIQSVAQAAQTACAGNTSTLTSIVQPVLDRAQAALTRASTTLGRLATLTTQAQTTNSGTSGQASGLAQLANDYQTFLANASLPTSEEMAQASVDSKAGGAGATATLFTQMTTLAQNSCGAASAN